MESILTSIKKLLLVPEEYEQFDADIIMHINSAFMNLTQLGVGPSTGFYIMDKSTEWADFTTDLTKLQAIKTYIYLKVRLVFDPASLGSATLAAYERQIQELEWRLNLVAESNDNTETVPSIPIAPSGGGTSDYTKLQNLPSINGKTLIGNYDEKDPSVKEMSEDDVARLWDELVED